MVEYLKVPVIRQTDIYERNTFRHKVFDWKVDQGEVTNSRRVAWTGERKRTHSERNEGISEFSLCCHKENPTFQDCVTVLTKT